MKKIVLLLSLLFIIAPVKPVKAMTQWSCGYEIEGKQRTVTAWNCSKKNNKYNWYLGVNVKSKSDKKFLKSFKNCHKVKVKVRTFDIYIESGHNFTLRSWSKSVNSIIEYGTANYKTSSGDGIYNLPNVETLPKRRGYEITPVDGQTLVFFTKGECQLLSFHIL